MARIGELHHTSALELRAAAVPGDFRVDAQAKAYCDALGGFADAFRTEAVERFTACLRRATREGALVGEARLCERRMNDYDTLGYPVTRELFGSAVYDGSAMVSYGVQLVPAPAPDARTTRSIRRATEPNPPS
jgi:hypothetical protein